MFPAPARGNRDAARAWVAGSLAGEVVGGVVVVLVLDSCADGSVEARVVGAAASRMTGEMWVAWVCDVVTWIGGSVESEDSLARATRARD